MFIRDYRSRFLFNGFNRASSWKALNIEMTTRIIMIANGNAAIMEAVCSAPSPPCQSKTAAVPDCTTPHTNLIFVLGFKFPYVVCIPKTNVAESADVIKNVLISRTAKTDIIADNG